MRSSIDYRDILASERKTRRNQPTNGTSTKNTNSHVLTSASVACTAARSDLIAQFRWLRRWPKGVADPSEIWHRCTLCGFRMSSIETSILFVGHFMTGGRAFAIGSDCCTYETWD
jgi:hypothetical protein